MPLVIMIPWKDPGLEISSLGPPSAWLIWLNIPVDSVKVFTMPQTTTIEMKYGR